MVPYIDIPSYDLGPLTLHPFGFLVGLAIVLGTIVSDRRTAQVGLDTRVSADVALWAVIPGFIVAHLYSVIFYFPEKILADPLVLLKFWEGISSFGGFLGGAGGVIAYFKIKKIPFWPYADCIIYGFAFAWIFGRLGCTVAHDHPGIPTDFFLAVNYPATPEYPAGPRHDLGFYEFLWAIALSAYFYSQRLKPKFTGWYLATFVIAYMPIRFLFDFLRTADMRYFATVDGQLVLALDSKALTSETVGFVGFTAGQFAAFVLFFVGIWMWRYRSRVGELLVPDGQPHRFADGTLAKPATAGGGAAAKTRKAR